MTILETIVRGRALAGTFTNNSGGALAGGDVVVIDTTGNLYVKTSTTVSDLTVVGVCLSAAAAGASVLVNTGGNVETLNVTGVVSRGDYLRQSGTVKLAESAGTTRAPGVFAIAHTASAGGVVSARVFDVEVSSGAPDNADYLVRTANGSLSAERVVTDTDSVTWDWATAGQAKATVATLVGDSGAGGTKGLVPAPAAGDAAASKFLKADGVWTVAGGSGDPAWTTYTPTWTASVNPAIGNGTLTGAYIISGKTLRFRIYMLAGSTTTFGTGEWSFGLPTGVGVVAKTGANQAAVVYGLDAGTAHKMGVAHISSAGTTFPIGPSLSGGSNWGSAVPHTWAVNDHLELNGVIEID